MTITLPNPGPPIHAVSPEPSREQPHQFQIVGRFTAVCSCGHKVRNPKGVTDADGKKPIWFLTSNDARRAAERHHIAAHR